MREGELGLQLILDLARLQVVFQGCRVYECRELALLVLALVSCGV